MSAATADAFLTALRTAGTRVRKRHDPSKVGESTGETEGQALNDLMVRVRYGVGRPEWEYAEELELVADDSGDPVTRMLKGRPGRLRDLRRELARAQLSGRLSDVFYSMDTTNTEFMPHQFMPVLKLLDSPSQGLLIADEVGLGKTIEAGLIWTELRF